MKYRKKQEDVVDAVQWFTLGDHPLVNELVTRGNEPCKDCGSTANHGIIIAEGLIVHPGNWVIDLPDGKHCVCSPDYFSSVYEEATEASAVRNYRSMMGFQETLSLMKAGYLLARRSWADGYYVSRSPNSDVFTKKRFGKTGSSAWAPSGEDMMANDWVIVELTGGSK